MIEAIRDLIARRYRRDEYPALADLMERWEREKPFSGVSVLDATPVFTNTLVKYCALLAGGAKLSIGVGELTPYDPEVIAFLKRLDVPVVSPADCGSFDVILDCAANFAVVPSRCGYVELTRSGVYRYRQMSVPVFFADSGRIKRIETTLGTGEGCLRALRHLNIPVRDRRALVFGGGKVGLGIAAYLARDGARVSVVDMRRDLQLPAGVTPVDGANAATVAAEIGAAELIVSATGIAGALAQYAEAFRACRAVIANMGVEDEYGPDVPAERVLNNKRPLNFILDEPTHLKYIDPTMALSNAGALELLLGRVGNGINPPDAAMENGILEIVRRDGCIAEELNMLEE